CALLFAVALVSCSEKKDDSPPFIDSTCHENCLPPLGGGNGGTKPPPSTTLDGGVVITPDGGFVTLSVNVWALTDTVNTLRKAFSGAGNLTVKGLGSSPTAAFAGSAAEVPDVPAIKPLWVAAEPTETTFLTTLQAVAGTASVVDVDVVSRDAILQAFGSSTVTPPAARPE